MRVMFAEETGEDWRTIGVRWRKLEKLVSPNKGQLRYITKDVFEQMMGKPLLEVVTESEPSW